VQVAFKRGAGPWPRRACSSLSSRARRRHLAPAAATPCHGPSRSLQRPNPRLPTPLKPRRAAPLLLRSRARRRRAPGAYRGWQPPAPLHTPPPATSTPKIKSNRSIVVPRPFPHPSPAKSRRTSPDFYSTTPASRAQDHIAKRRFFPRASIQKVNSNSKTLWLILVNCVENREEIKKMQDQFCWIHCELFYNFCYSG
jgi:hypothetical protein